MSNKIKSITIDNEVFAKLLAGITSVDTDTSTLSMPELTSPINIESVYTEDDLLDCKEEHSAQPIKSLDDLALLSRYLIDKGKYRDYMLLVVGVNTGLRYSDFSRLKFIHFIDPTKLKCADPFRDEIVIEEQKTSKTKGTRVNRHIAINNAIKKAIRLYLAHTPCVSLKDYLFVNQSRNKGVELKPMTRRGIEYNFKRYTSVLNIDVRAGSHMFRKTFGYQYMMRHKDDARALQRLQKMFNHSSETITLRYIGITPDEQRADYLELNLADLTDVLDI